MKKIVQLLLIIFLIIICIIFYRTYFTKKEIVKIENKSELIQNQNSLNNIVQNLAYEVKIDKNRKYLIKSKFSEISNNNEFEFTRMQQVDAKFTNKNFQEISIKSDKANYNNSNNNTNFSGNVEINFNNNKILSEKIDLDFEKQYILIHGNVKFKGNSLNMNADNIGIDLLKKELNIYMNNNKKVKFLVNKND